MSRQKPSLQAAVWLTECVIWYDTLRVSCLSRDVTGLPRQLAKPLRWAAKCLRVWKRRGNYEWLKWPGCVKDLYRAKQWRIRLWVRLVHGFAWVFFFFSSTIFEWAMLLTLSARGKLCYWRAHQQPSDYIQLITTRSQPKMDFSCH